MIRIGHTWLTHKHLITSTDPDQCLTYGETLLLKHIICYWWNYDIARSSLDLAEHLHEALGPDPGNISKLFKFLKSTYVYNLIYVCFTFTLDLNKLNILYANDLRCCGLKLKKNNKYRIIKNVLNIIFQLNWSFLNLLIFMKITTLTKECCHLPVITFTFFNVTY